MHAREFANLVVPGKLSLPFTLSRDCNTIQTNSINKVPKQFQEMEQQEGKNVGIRLNTWVRLVNAYFPSYVYECNQDFLWDINTYISTVLQLNVAIKQTSQKLLSNQCRWLSAIRMQQFVAGDVRLVVPG
jgi:hypothetical protein